MQKVLYNQEMINSTMRLFKGYNSEVKEEISSLHRDNLLKAAVYVHAAPSVGISLGVYRAAKAQYGVDTKTLNNTFHKSFATVQNADYGTLVMQQLLHYMTTYGFESLGIYNKDTVYIPNEPQEGCENIAGLRLAIIRPYTADEIKDKVKILVLANIGLSEDMLDDIMLLLPYYFSGAEISGLLGVIQNRELLIRICDSYNLVPKKAEDFLRYVIYKATGNSLLIKSPSVLAGLEGYVNMNQMQVAKWLDDLDAVEMSKSYHRLHEYWLMMKQCKLGDRGARAKINSFVNRISKMSRVNHIPLMQNTLQNIVVSPITYVGHAVKEASNAQLIKVWEYVLRVLSIADSNVKEYPVTYRIRNGRTWTKVTKVASKDILAEKLVLIENELIFRYEKLKGTQFVIPKGLEYPMFTSGKAAVGEVPQGTLINLDKLRDSDNVIVAIHWQNHKGRVDLDLHASFNGGMVGWNSRYRDSERTVLHSGDITDAPGPKGATEALLVKFQKGDTIAFNVNNYTHNAVEVPFDLIIARGDKSQLQRDLVIDPARILAQFKMKTLPHQNQMELGTLLKQDEGFCFSLGGNIMGDSIVTRDDEIQKLVREATEFKFKHRVVLKDFFNRLLDVKVFDAPPEEGEFIDLRLEALQADTFLKLFFSEEQA